MQWLRGGRRRVGHARLLTLDQTVTAPKMIVPVTLTRPDIWRGTVSVTTPRRFGKECGRNHERRLRREAFRLTFVAPVLASASDVVSYALYPFPWRCTMRRFLITSGFLCCGVCVMTLVWVAARSAFATDCTMDCSGDTKICQGTNYSKCTGCDIAGVSCSSLSNKVWANPVTRGSLQGSFPITWSSVHCYTLFPCSAGGTVQSSYICYCTDGKGNLRPPCKCDWWPLQTCTNCSVGAGTNFGVETCVKGTCGEE